VQLPEPACPYGYTSAQIEEIMGSRLEAFNHFMVGQTMSVCDGREYDHDKKEYHPTACADSPHGVVTYTVDVRRFLAGRPPLD